ncbi:MAG: DUF1822 family protein [Arthrospira sp. SH-MAG29]|nr:DUF1822 family protein [Arthrospira sp. SH-MAG29]MBS0016137.1 DUF1822 family protein [Arthrospira sp. SH-MAG29]
MFTIEDLTELHPDRLWLSFSEEQRETAWQYSRLFSHAYSQWNGYLNRLAINAVIPGLQEELDLNPTIWQPNLLPSFWENVNGTRLLINDNYSVVIIPSETVDTEEFRVPQEWVDIPSWVANYYLAVQVYPEAGYLQVWGYATHQQLKNQAVYDEFERVYVLPKADIIDDLNVMVVAQELCETEIAFVSPLPPLYQNQAERWLEQLSSNTLENPRLAMPFYQWAALIANDKWREELYQRRCDRLSTQIRQSFNYLSQWLADLALPEWQDFRGLWRPRQMEYRGETVDFRGETNRERVASLVDVILGKNSEELWKTSAQSLRYTTPGNPRVIEALVNLLAKTTEEETRWAAAETLWLLDPENPAAGIRKLKDLGMEITGELLSLMVAVLPKRENRLAVFLRLYAMGEREFLSPGVQLRVWDEMGTLFDSATARERDNYIQIKLSGNLGEWLNVEVKWGENSIMEGFLI